MDRASMSLDNIIRKDKALNRQKNSNKKSNGRRQNLQNGSKFKVQKDGRKNNQNKKNLLGLNEASRHIQKRNAISSKTNQLAEKVAQVLLHSRQPKESQIDQNKIFVSNLNADITEEDLIELFGELSFTGFLTSVQLYYDRTGNSLGTAEIVYERSQDAKKALKTYNEVPLDGQPMKIEIVGQNVVTPRPLKVGQIERNNGQNFNFKNDMPPKFKPKNKINKKQGNSDRRPHSQKAKGKIMKKTDNNKAKKPTAEELDAEMDAYMNSVKSE